MKLFTIACLILSVSLLACTSSKTSQSATSRVSKPSGAVIKQNPFYEMRTYYSPSGKLDDLHARFRNHTMEKFAKHGMVNIAYWVPVENGENKLIYILAYPNREARETAWKSFGADLEWQAIAKASEANGKIVSKAESVFLEDTDYSPAFNSGKKNNLPLYELRTYTASPGNIDNLHDRFRNHTLKLFEKHGMKNIAYWKPTDPKLKDVLIYVIAHKDKQAAEASWIAFRDDPTWIEAKKASEVKGGGSLTTKVESVFMTTTDYSPIK